MCKLVSRRRVMVLLLCALAVLAGGLASPVRAGSVWYVLPGIGNDATCAAGGPTCGTIQGAIDKAAAGDTIDVAAGTYFGTTAQLVDVTKSLTLSGGWGIGFTSADGMSVLEAADARRGLVVRPGVDATASRFDIRNGRAPAGGDGGGILD